MSRGVIKGPFPIKACLVDRYSLGPSDMVLRCRHLLTMQLRRQFQCRYEEAIHASHRLHLEAQTTLHVYVYELCLEIHIEYTNPNQYSRPIPRLRTHVLCYHRIITRSLHRSRVQAAGIESHWHSESDRG